MIPRWIAAGLFVLAMAFASEPSRAAPEDGKKFGDWSVKCDENAQNTAAGKCFIAHQVSNNQTNQTVMVIAIGYVEADKLPVAVVTLPLGIRLPPGVGVQVDQGEGLKYPFERCLPDGCQVQFRLSEAQINSFQNGIAGKVLFQDPTGRDGAFPFSLKGFTAAFNSLK